jgi:hypothetical protein
MATLTEIFSLEKYAESACVTILKANGIPNVYRQRSTWIKFSTPFVTVQYQNGAITGHMTRLAANQSAYDAWSGKLMFDIVTNRRDQPDPVHDEYRAKIRYLFQYFQEKFTTSVLPYHQFTAITEGDTQPSIDSPKELDITQISFDTLLSVRTGVWP